MSKETEHAIHEMQMLDHSMQNLLSQKQAFTLELNETLNALEEVKKTNDKIYKIVGQVMLKADKPEILKELEEKKRIIELRMSAIEKQEKLIEAKAEQLKKETQKSTDKKG